MKSKSTPPSEPVPVDRGVAPPRPARSLRLWTLATVVLVGAGVAFVASQQSSEATPGAGVAQAEVVASPVPVTMDVPSLDLLTHVATPEPLANTSPTTNTTGPITVTTALEREKVFDPNRPVHMVVTVDAAQAPPDKQRPPARIALVVDCSSSMSGNAKIGFARKAVESFLNGLAPEDSCTVIAFSSDVRTVVPWIPGAERVPVELLTQLQASGGTNMHEGIAAGARALAALPKTDTPDLRRVVVLSDGAPSVGVTQPEAFKKQARALQEQGITLSCHGFGNGVNAQLLTDMSELGGGTFLFVDSGERAVLAFESELAQAQATVATRTQVRITPAPGVSIEKVVSWTAQADGASQSVHVGDLPAGAQRKVVVRLRWARPDGQPSMKMADVSWSTVAVEDGKIHDGSSSPVALLAATADEAQASSNEALRLRLADARFAESMNHVKELLEKGDDVAAVQSAAEAHALYKLQNPEGLANINGQAFMTSDAAQEFYETGRLELKSARCMIAGSAQAVGR